MRIYNLSKSNMRQIIKKLFGLVEPPLKIENPRYRERKPVLLVRGARLAGELQREYGDLYFIYPVDDLASVTEIVYL